VRCKCLKYVREGEREREEGVCFCKHRKCGERDAEVVCGALQCLKYICIYIYIYVYIYVYSERERNGEESSVVRCHCLKYVYIYTARERERWRGMWCGALPLLDIYIC